MPLLEASGCFNSTRKYQYLGSFLSSKTVRGLNSLPNYKHITTKNYAPLNCYFWMNKSISVPAGYRLGNYLQAAIGDGGLACLLLGDSDLSAIISAIAVLNAILDGLADLTATGNIGSQINSLINGSALLDLTAGAVGTLTSNIDVGASPTAQDIADAVWSRVLSPFATPNTAGYILNALGSGGGGATADDVAEARDAVLEEVKKRLKTSTYIALK